MIKSMKGSTVQLAHHRALELVHILARLLILFFDVLAGELAARHLALDPGIRLIYLVDFVL